VTSGYDIIPDSQFDKIKKLGEWLGYKFYENQWAMPSDWIDKHGIKGSIRDWNPYENIKDAWELFKKLEEYNYYLQVRWNPKTFTWEATIEEPKSDFWIWKSGDIAQEVICEAVLEFISLSTS